MSQKIVNLFIVGAPKCGTTAWAQYLDQHPEIDFSNDKEPHYFCEDFDQFRWARNNDEYQKFFDGAEFTSKYWAEASPMYLYSTVAASKIRNYNPDAKILILLREPVSFLHSYHRQLLNIHEENLKDINAAWSAQKQRSQGQRVPVSNREASFLQYSQVADFAPQVNRYLKQFGPDQVKVLIFEEWTKDPASAFLDVLKFLQLNPISNPDFNVVNAAYQPRNNLLSMVLNRPPRWILRIASTLARLIGRERLGVAAVLKTANRNPKPNDYTSASGQTPPFTDDLAAHAISVEKLMGRPLPTWTRKSESE